MSEKIKALIAEMGRQISWLDWMQHKDHCAEQVVLYGSCEYPFPEKKWGPGKSLARTTRCCNRQDRRRVETQETWRAWRDAGEPGPAPHQDTDDRPARTRVSILVRGFRKWTKNGPVGPHGFIDKLTPFRLAALREAHKHYPSVAPLIVTACRIHTTLLESWASEEWNEQRDALYRHEKIVERINEFMPDPMSRAGFPVYTGPVGTPPRKPGPQLSECKKCGKFAARVKASPPGMQKLKCDECGATFKRTRPSKQK